MGFLLDANVILSVHLDEAFGERVLQYVENSPGPLLASDFILAECASAVARTVRVSRITRDQALVILQDCDRWVSIALTIAPVTSEDIRAATASLRRLDLNLRTPDAVNIATAARLGAALVTFDRRMAIAARALGVTAVEL